MKPTIGTFEGGSAAAINRPTVRSDTSAGVVARFWQKVDKNGPVPVGFDTPCWNWLASDNGKNGYGIFRGGTDRDAGGSRRWVLAHRYSYELSKGSIPERLQVDHKCKNRMCVNAAHLQLLTHRENTLASDGPSARQARRSHCIRGHMFDKVSGTKRRCSACDKDKESRRYIRRYGRSPKPRRLQ